MGELLKDIIKRSRYAIAGALFAVTIVAAGLSNIITLPNAANAASSCDKVNIIYCGLNGSSDAAYIKSFQNFYNQGKDSRNSDLKAVFNWAGAGASIVKDMNTSNTKVGTMDNHGNIVVDGQKVGYNAKMAARFRASNWTGVEHVEGNVYARTVTPSSTDFNSYHVLVHFNSKGAADFAVATTCGNAIKFVPVPPKPTPKPKPSLVCDYLTASTPSANGTVKFTAKATAKNTKISSYKFYFGDSHTQVVTTSQDTASVSHTYGQTGKSYKTSVYVNGTVTNDNCKKVVTAPKPPVKKALSCDLLTAVAEPVSQGNTSNVEFHFTATATPTNTTITKYVFDFGDKSQPNTVNTSSKTAHTAHTYPLNGKEYTATVRVYSADFPNGVTSAKCAYQVKAPTQPPKKVPALTCDQLTQSPADNQSMTYTLTASATPTNTQITKYVFTFGDGTTQTVETSDIQTSVTHTYSGNGKTFTASVKVYSADFPNGIPAEMTTDSPCQVAITTPPTPPQECKPGVPEGSPECNECVPSTPTNGKGGNECETQPTTLTNTGAGNVIGLFGVTAVIGGLLHQIVLRRKAQN